MGAWSNRDRRLQCRNVLMFLTIASDTKARVDPPCHIQSFRSQEGCLKNNCTAAHGDNQRICVECLHFVSSNHKTTLKISVVVLYLCPKCLLDSCTQHERQPQGVYRKAHCTLHACGGQACQHLAKYSGDALCDYEAKIDYNRSRVLNERAHNVVHDPWWPSLILSPGDCNQ